MFLKISEISQKNTCVGVSLLKTPCFPVKFPKFLRTSANDCFWYDIAANNYKMISKFILLVMFNDPWSHSRKLTNTHVSGSKKLSQVLEWKMEHKIPIIENQIMSVLIFFENNFIFTLKWRVSINSKPGQQAVHTDFADSMQWY